jgi:gliding motility-associated-like protein
MYSGFDPFEYEFLIFNRWGELIWETHNVSFGWDGSYNDGMKSPDGIYTWKLTFKTMNNDEKLMKTGHVTLIR